jgi:hypothetical protein
MTFWKPAALTLALAAAYPGAALAQSSADLMKELKALKDRVEELEKKLAADKAAPPADKQWGMTPEQLQEFNRIAVKTEALEDGRDANGFKGLKIAGYIDPAYIYNRKQHRAGFQFMNPVADGGYNYDNSYFGAALLDFQKETDSGVKWRLTLMPNRGAGSVIGDGSIVHEASVSVPLGDLQTRLLAGQLPDWSGYEYLPATQNKLITHNLLFDFTLPTAYTGVGAEFIRGKWDTKVMLANVNASRRKENEKTPVLVYRVDYSKGEYQGFGFAGLNGKIANFNVDPATGVQSRDTMANLIEGDAYFIRGDWTVQGQISYGMQRKAAIAPDPVTGELLDARWWGLSALAAYKFTPRLEGIARADYINNKKNGGGLLGYTGYFAPATASTAAVFGDYRNGIGANPDGDPNVGSNRYAIALGMGYAFDTSTTFKVEYRLDRASQAVFLDAKDGSFSKSNQLLGASVVVAF